jgi:hypothetical protein
MPRPTNPLYTARNQSKVNQESLTDLFRQLVHVWISVVVWQLLSARLHPGRRHVVDAEGLKHRGHGGGVEEGLKEKKIIKKANDERKIYLLGKLILARGTIYRLLLARPNPRK